MADILFYFFSGLAILSCVMVILSPNAVSSILFLVLSYFNVSALFIMIGADFAAMLLMVVYVGAVAVLFLFVVMMLDTDYGSFKTILLDHTPMIILLVLFFLTLVVLAYFNEPFLIKASGNSLQPYNGDVIKEVGKILYTDYFLHFQLSALVLLLAMIGAIALTLRHRAGVRKQNIASQVSRNPYLSVKNIHVPSGSSLRDDL